MMKRSVVYMDPYRVGAEGKHRILRGYRVDEDQITLAPDLYLVDSRQTIAWGGERLFGHVGAHGGVEVKCNLPMVIESQDSRYKAI